MLFCFQRLHLMLLTMKILQVNEEKSLEVLKHKRKSVRICKLLTVPIVSLPDNSPSVAHDLYSSALFYLLF